jgi:DNA primase
MEIQQIKTALPLPKLLQYYHLTPDRNQRLLCPFHEDKTPSMQVYVKTDTVYCFSSNCKTHGKSLDVIDFVMYKENITKHEAILKCQEILNYYQGKIEHKIIIEPTKPVANAQFLQTMFTYFKNAVANSKPAKEYLQSRNLDPQKIEVGYNTAQFHHVGRMTKANETEQLQELIKNATAAGLLTPSGISKTGETAYKSFGKECIVFAMRNAQNEIAGLYFRSITNNENAKHFYLKDSKGLYPAYPPGGGQDPNQGTKTLIITESIIDCASLLQYKAELAKQLQLNSNQLQLVAAYGTNRLNDEIQTAIKNLPNLQEIIFAFDNDEAGQQATKKYAQQLQTALPGVIFTSLNLPNKDVNETLQIHSPQIFSALLNERNSDFLFSPDTTEENKNAENPMLAGVPAPLPAHPQLHAYTSAPELPFAELQNNTIKNTSTLNTPAPAVLQGGNPHKLIFTTATAMYLVKGGVDKVLTKLNITLEIINEQLTNAINKRRFKIDLYESKQVEKTAQEAAEHLQLTQQTIAQDLHYLTEQLDQYREKIIQEEQENQNQEPTIYIMTTQEKTEALQLAHDKNLLTQITQKLSHTGIVGEEENKTFLFVIAASHIQQHPLNALIQGSSGSGKTNLLKGIYKIMPEENKKIYSRCSEKMLYNVPKYYFKNKLVCFEDVDGLGEDAEYAWRELVSNGELVSGVTYKDERGIMGIKELQVYGPITSIACTTKGAIYADNMSRLFLIAIDESKEQTKKINAYQALEAAGQINRTQQQQALQQLQNFVRLLKPYQVHNPHATKLKLPEGIRDERRLYRLYLYFIDMITVLHQYQREKIGDKKLIATKQDCQLAKDLLFECIMLKMDELDGSLRQFFERLKEYVQSKQVEHYRFTQREIREALKISKTHLYRFLTELVELEYVQENRFNGNQGNSYQIKYFDDYKRVRTDVKSYLQMQIDQLVDNMERK